MALGHVGAQQARRFIAPAVTDCAPRTRAGAQQQIGERAVAHFCPQMLVGMGQFNGARACGVRRRAGLAKQDAHVEERRAALSDAVPIFAVAAAITPTAAVSERMPSSTSRTIRAYFASPLAPAWYDCGAAAAAAPDAGAPAQAPSRARLSRRDAITFLRGCSCYKGSWRRGFSRLLQPRLKLCCPFNSAKCRNSPGRGVFQQFQLRRLLNHECCNFGPHNQVTAQLESMAWLGRKSWSVSAPPVPCAPWS